MTVEGHQVVNRREALKKGPVLLVDQPSEMSLRQGTSQTSNSGQSVAEVTEAACFDDEETQIPPVILECVLNVRAEAAMHEASPQLWVCFLDQSAFLQPQWLCE